MRRKIIILTKSDKKMGYCVAGIDAETGEWVRVVSDNLKTECAIPYEGLNCSDGSVAEIYDVVEIDFLKHVPTHVQPENFLYNEKMRWRKIGKSCLKEVLDIHGGYDCPRYVFGDADRRLDDGNLYLGKQSLLLLKLDWSEYFVKVFPERTKVQINFTYNNSEYKFFSVTDREIKDKFKCGGSYPTETVSFVFSLTDKYDDGRYYKVMAQALI